MQKDLERIGEESLKQISSCTDLEALEQMRITVLGKKGQLSEVLRSLGTLSAEERPKMGAFANEWKVKIENAITERKTVLESSRLNARLSAEQIDVTLPSRKLALGSLHPVTQTTRKMISIFKRLGFDTALGPEIDTEYLTFDAVNIPKEHPARDMQDTFFVGPGVVLRTHTTPVQMRTMLSQKPPVRVLCPGAVYRCDDDATHSPMFHQMEGLWVDKNVRMSDLKGVLEFFAKELFGPETKIRLRPSYFSFVEPGAEVDVYHKKLGWLELLGAGMVHPRLFENAGYPKDQYTGFAFGIGIDRAAMILHEITDLRKMFSGDPRFLKQF